MNTFESQHFCCPITGRLMRDLVITRWGSSFERSAILRAIKNTGLDPVARKPIRDLRPGKEISENAGLRRAIASAHGQLPPLERPSSSSSHVADHGVHGGISEDPR